MSECVLDCLCCDHTCVQVAFFGTYGAIIDFFCVEMRCVGVWGLSVCLLFFGCFGEGCAFRVVWMR